MRQESCDKAALRRPASRTSQMLRLCQEAVETLARGSGGARKETEVETQAQGVITRANVRAKAKARAS